jgi:hypothetical protein
MTPYARGFRDGVEAAARALERTSISPPEAKAHITNGAQMLRRMVERGDLVPPPQARQRARKGGRVA